MFQSDFIIHMSKKIILLAKFTAKLFYLVILQPNGVWNDQFGMPPITIIFFPSDLHVVPLTRSNQVGRTDNHDNWIRELIFWLIFSIEMEQWPRNEIILSLSLYQLKVQLFHSMKLMSNSLIFDAYSCLWNRNWRNTDKIWIHINLSSLYTCKKHKRKRTGLLWYWDKVLDTSIYFYIITKTAICTIWLINS